MAPNYNPFERLIEGNKIFARRTLLRDPVLFPTLAQKQEPKVLWLGCADSRVPETTICDVKPGDVFVHRNIANVIRTSDVSSASVIEYSVTHVGVEHIVVCGHTKCGGAHAAMGDDNLGETLNEWLKPVRELRQKHADELSALGSADEKANRLAELNVQMSIDAVKKHPAVTNAIQERGLKVHGVIYDIPEGSLKVLDG